MPPDPGPTAGAVFDKRLLTMPTLLWHHDHNLVHLLDRQQPAAGPPVSGLATPLPSGGRRLRARRGLGWIRRGGREELVEFCPSRASSSRTRSCKTAFSARSAVFSRRNAANCS